MLQGIAAALASDALFIASWIASSSAATLRVICLMLERIADTATSPQRSPDLHGPRHPQLAIATVIQNNASADGLGFARSPRMFRARVMALPLDCCTCTAPLHSENWPGKDPGNPVLSVICMLLD